MIIKKVNGILLIEKHGKSRIKTTKETTDKFHIWICNHRQGINSPLTNENINIKNHTKGEVIEHQM